MKYTKGKQKYSLDDCDMIKVRVVADGDGEIPWAKKHKGADHFVLMNDAISFYPCRSWGAVFYSSDKEVDVTEIRGESPADLELELHPEAWDQYIENGLIDSDGNIILEEAGE